MSSRSRSHRDVLRRRHPRLQGEKAYTRAEALQHFRDAETMYPQPFIYLSAGVSNPVFIETSS